MREWVSGYVIGTARDMWERDTRTRKGGCTNKDEICKHRVASYFMYLVCVHLSPFCPLISGCVVILCRTWAERIACQLLDALPFTDGAAIEWCRIGAAACAFLETAAAAAVAHGPLCPCGPSTVHWN